MKTIYTYPIPIEGEFSINLPVRARVIDVTTKHGEPILVAMVDTEADSTLVDFALRRTGTPMDDLDPDDYLGSFTISDGNVTFFLFQVPECEHIMFLGLSGEAECWTCGKQ